MSYVEVAKLADVADGSALRVAVEGVDIAVVHTNGEVYAIEDTCSHAEVSLAEGEIDKCFIECWLHGSRFDLRTGSPTGPPAVEPVPTYPVRIEGDGPDRVILVSVTGEESH